MKMRLRLLPGSAALAGGMLMLAPLQAQQVAEVDLVKARAPGGQAELQRRGYRQVSTQAGSDRIWSNWWNDGTRTCLSVVTREGKLDSIVTASAPDCGQQGAPVGGARPPRPQGPESDLVGARASSGESQLVARGYRNVGGSTGSDRKWSYWWRDRTRTCLSVATVNGRYDAITATPEADCRRGAGGPNPPYPPPPGNPPPRPGQGSYVPGDDHWAGGRRIDIGLMCFGEGARPTTATNYGWTWNDRTDRYDYGNRTELTREQFDASLTVQIWDGGGRIRLPKKLIPPINSRGADGWWDLTDVSVGPDFIRAGYRLNGLNKPRVTIDRRSGRINVQGSYSYSFRGTCDLVGQPRRF